MTEINDNLIINEEPKKGYSKLTFFLITLGILSVIAATLVGAHYFIKGDLQSQESITLNAQLNDSPVVIAKSLIDTAEYKLITLAGGQEVLLIKGAEGTKFGAAVSVHTGSLTDFFKYEGLAHMSEHALFGGSKAYGVNEFLTYCQSMGGNVNAETFDEYTTYLFELLSKETFDQAMKILANQVLYPSFNQEYVFGESLNVNSEYINSYETDEEKLNKIIKVNSRKDGPFYQLTVGNFETLRVSKTKNEFVETIKRYYKTYYKPKDMKLVVQGPVDFAVLEKAANDFFTTPEPKSNLQREPPTNDENPEERYYNINAFPIENRKRLIWWNSNSASPTVNFVFYIDLNRKQTTLVNPHTLIEYHLNNKEKNSFYDKLISGGLALDVSTDHSTLFSDFTLLYIKVSLTKTGLQNVNTIGKYLFSYIKKIQETDNQEIIDQIKKNSANRFNFAEKNPDIFDSINMATINLHYSDKASVLNRDYNYSKLDKAAQDSIFKFLTPEYLLILVGTNDKDEANRSALFKQLKIENEQIWRETSYNTDYVFRPLTDTEVSEFKNVTSDSFILRPINPYSTKKEKLIDQTECDKTAKLVEVVSKKEAVFSYLIDKCYRTPKVAGQVHIIANPDKSNNNEVATLEILNAKLQYYASRLINSLIDGGSEASTSFTGR